MLRFSKEISLTVICNCLIINHYKIWNLHDIRRFFQLDHCDSILRFFHRNASIDYLKHKDVEFDYLQKIIESHQAYSIGDDEEDGFFTEEIFRQLFMTIDSLPERCRQVFLLYMEGKKNEEIAAVLCVSLETVKTQKKRAMSFLRKKLGPHHFALLLSILP